MLKSLFTSNVRVKILKLLFLNPNQQFYVREISRLLDEQLNSVRRELDNLSKIQLLSSRVQNRKKYFKINQKCKFIKELRQLVLKNGKVLDGFIKEFNKKGSLDLLMIAGVYLNQMDPFDILIIGEIKGDLLENLLEKHLITKTNVQFMETAQFAERFKAKDPLILSLIKNENFIKLHSNIDEFVEI